MGKIGLGGRVGALAQNRRNGGEKARRQMDIRPNRWRYGSKRSGVVYVGNRGCHMAGYWGRGAMESRLNDLGILGF